MTGNDSESRNGTQAAAVTLSAAPPGGGGATHTELRTFTGSTHCRSGVMSVLHSKVIRCTCGGVILAGAPSGADPRPESSQRAVYRVGPKLATTAKRFSPNPPMQISA